MRKWLTVFSVHMADSLTYRAQAVIWMLTDTVPAILMPLIWLSSYGGRTAIQGFTPSGMVAYYMAMLALTSFTVSHIQWDIGTEIREGRFSVYLTRPFSYMAYCYASNLSWRLLRLAMFVPIAGIIAALFAGKLRWEGYSLGWEFWLAAVGAHALSFLIGYALGLLALYFTEARSIFLFYYMPMSVLSGEIVPLPLLPKVVQDVGRWLPFRYTLSLPLEIFQHRVAAADLALSFGILAGWIVLVLGLIRVLWVRGLRQYTGVRM